jgi:uncharacterized protein
MKTFRFICILMSILVFSLTACGTAPGHTPTGVSTPPPESSPTREPLPVTPPESAFAPGPTAAPLEELLATHAVTFDTPDGVTITGALYGSGKTAVVFSVMGNCRRGWEELAQLTAAQGLMALTYPWRDCGRSGPTDEAALIQNFVNDARGAVNFVRAQGAEDVILVGASLGGLASAKLAIESQASGLVIFASPVEIPGHEFQIDASDLDTDIPKLFLTTENDTVVPLESSRALYDLAAEPKKWQTYPGYAHGTDLFTSESGAAAQQRILQFILEIASKN